MANIKIYKVNFYILDFRQDAHTDKEMDKPLGICEIMQICLKTVQVRPSDTCETNWHEVGHSHSLAQLIIVERLPSMMEFGNVRVHQTTRKQRTHCTKLRFGEKARPRRKRYIYL